MERNVMTFHNSTPDMLLVFIDITVRKTSKDWHPLRKITELTLARSHVCSPC
jgi:hypothetical protein